MFESPLGLHRTLRRRLVPLAYALGVVVAVILLFTWMALRAQVSVAGFLNGESIWSKAQKQSVIALSAYAASGSSLDYATFQRNYAVLQSDRWVRDAVRRPHYDPAKVNAAFDRGSVMQSARPGMIFMMRHLAWAPYVDRVIRDWRASDPLVDELGAIAKGLRADYLSGDATQASVAAAQAHIHDLDERIAPLSADFSRTLAEGAEWFAHVLFLSVLTAAGLASLLWLGMAHRVVSGVRGSEERYGLLFDSTLDAILMIDDATGRILAANHAAGKWSGRDSAQVQGLVYAQWREQCGLREMASDDHDLHADDESRRPVETQTSKVLWGKRRVLQAIVHDVSERVERERSRRIAAEALASITEGVMIADVHWRVISVNAAACRITGFDSSEWIGKRLDWSRTFPDGDSLPNAMWAAAAAQGHWSGEVKARRADGRTYAEHLGISAICGGDQRIVYYVAVFSDISKAKADHSRLQRLATHDPLTGLVNRAEFQRRCDAAITRAAIGNGVVGVLFVDLDAFKFVNDSYSHATGDRLLKLVSARILGQLRDGDLLGRIGGDEFTVLLPTLEMREEAAALSDRVLAALSAPFRLDECEISISASIGVASYPLDGDGARALIANADSAMYAAKNQQRNAFRFYAPMMRADAQNRVRLATQLRHALANDQFRVLYQPIVAMESGRVIGAEALIRWQHPEKGVVTPVDFIPVAENIGLVHSIDTWVMQTVCAQIRIWDAANMPPIRLSINVSARWFSYPGFVDSVRNAMEACNVAPHRIVLEITESSILRLGAATRRTMQSLAAMGVAVAIDDFGTGYASMSYLKLPAVAYVKIDRSFVAGLPDSVNDAAVTSAMLAMARAMGLTVIAEGVETEAQHRFLTDAQCAAGQGYLYSYPVPAAVLEHQLHPGSPTRRARLTLVSS